MAGEKETQKFLSDAEVASHPIYWLFYILTAPITIFFNAYDVIGLENMPPKVHLSLSFGHFFEF